MWLAWNREISLLRDFLTCNQMECCACCAGKEETISVTSPVSVVTTTAEGIYIDTNASPVPIPTREHDETPRQDYEDNEGMWPSAQAIPGRSLDTPRGDDRVKILVVRRDRKNNTMGLGFHDKDVPLT